MTTRLRVGSFWAALGVAGFFGGVPFGVRYYASGDLVERWFLPGPLGHEVGRAPDSGALTKTAFLTRHVGGLDSVDGQEWARRNQLTAPLNFSHNLLSVFPPSLFDRRPDYFPWVNGQRERPKGTGQAWNPDLARNDVAEHAAAAARAAFAREPFVDSFALGVNDGLIFGESPEVRAAVLPPRWFRGRPDYSNLVFGFMNRAAENLARTHPDKYLGALAYYWAENAPEFRVHPQVVPYLTADRAQGYDAGFVEEERALQERWAKAGPRRLGLYDYLDGYGFLIPRIHFHCLAANLKQARALGFTDYYGEGGPNWGIDGPTTWLVAQLLQNPDADTEALLTEYYDRFFKAAAGPMRRFFNRCEEQWMRQPGASYWLKYYRNESQAEVFPSAVCAELRGLLDEAGRLSRDETTQRRVKLVADTFGVTERFVAFNEARAILGRDLAMGALSGAAGVEKLTHYLDARREFVRYLNGVVTREPLALATVPLDDFLRHNPAFAAAVALVRSEPVATHGKPPAWRALASRPESWVTDGIDFALRRAAEPPRELLLDSSLEGPPRAGRRIAGLAYGVDLPGEWRSNVEPSQAYVGALLPRAARSGQAGLHVAGAINSSVYQWCRASEGNLYVASVYARGQVASSSAVFMIVSWLDEKWRRMGTSTTVRLPGGTWPDWVQLQHGVRAPQGAAWVGVGMQCMNQLPGDWAEFDDVSVIDGGLLRKE